MGKPTKCITVAEARQLQDNWVTTRAVDIERSRGQQDTREVIWSLSELQEYLDYVKEESTKQGLLNPGIRIYFAAYNTPKDDHATVFLAPTSGGNVGDSNNYNIDPFNRGQSGWPPQNY